MRARQLLKDVLWWFNVRTLYSRITLTRSTTCYFFLVLASCIVQVILQASTFSVNTQGVQMLSTILAEAKISQGFPIIQGSALQICDSIPGQDGTVCYIVSGQNSTSGPKTAGGQDQVSSVEGRRALTGETQFDPSGNLQGVIISDGTSPPQTLSDQCVVSLSWLNDILRNARSEDAVTLAFQIWLLGLSVVTILNESIPHLFAVLASHILDTVWAGFRVRLISQTRTLYEKFVVNDACNGVDINAALWEARMSNAIVVVTVNCIAFFGVLCISLKLFNVYKSQTVKYVGTTTRANTAYKFVLVFSVSLQLAGFFILASTALWIDKVSSGTIRRVANHFSLYQAAFVVMAILEMPWLVVGWISVRRKKRSWFAAFLILGLVLVIISSVMFASALYRFVFKTWSFFATMTVFAYILLVLTAILGTLCRLKFGSGLTDYLTIGEKMEEPSFAPAHVADRQEKPLPNVPVQAIPAADSKKVPFQVIAAPTPAVVKGNMPSTPRHVKSILRRLSGKPRPLAVTFVDAAQSTAPPPTSPAETLDDIVRSYGSTSPVISVRTSRPRSRIDANRLTLSLPSLTPTMSVLSPPRRLQARITSRWSMSTAGDDATRTRLPTTNSNGAHHVPKKIVIGLPYGPGTRN